MSMNNNIITLDMVRRGIAQGLINFKPNTNDGYEVVCQIGEHWFYFVGMDSESMLAEEYIKCTPLFDIEQEVYCALDSFYPNDEYQYYYWYLMENLIPHQHITKKKFHKYLMSRGIKRNWANEVCEIMFMIRRYYSDTYLLSYQNADILANRILHDIDIPPWMQVSF